MVIFLQVEQCGNQIGNAFWNTVAAEHKLAKDGKFTRNKDGPEDQNQLDKMFYKIIPRASLVELESRCLDVIKASSIDTMLSDSLDAFDESGAGNNWVKGHYTRGAELIGLSARFSNYIVIWR